MISRAGRWIYFDICKNAGTSVGLALKRHFPDAIGKHHSWPNLSADRRYCTPISNDAISSYFTFAIVRDPYTRAVSNYQWHLRNHSFPASVSILEFLEIVAASDWGRFNPDPYFTDVDHVLRIRPQSHWLGIEPDFIGRFERMSLEWMLIGLYLKISP